MNPYLKVGGHVIGKKHLQAMPFWIPTALSYGAAAVIAFVWITDITAIMAKVPFYKTKFAYPYENDKLICVEPRYKV